MERTITIQQIKDAAQEAYNLYKDNTDGKNADYIPYLANIDPKLFGISICLMNGEIIQLGDSQYRFGIESVSKVLTAILVLRQYGAPKVLEMIGADATGLPFTPRGRRFRRFCRGTHRPSAADARYPLWKNKTPASR